MDGVSNNVPGLTAPVDLTAPIRVERNGAIGILTLERRRRFNSLDTQSAELLYQSARELADDEGVRVILFQGTAGIFCSGADLKFIRSEAQEAGRPYGPWFRAIVDRLHRTICTLRRAPKPVIVAIDGAAAAGGMGVALGSGDLVVASARSSFEYAYFKTGLTGAESMTFFLPKLVGLRKAMELAFLSQKLTAADAYRLGLITKVYPDESFKADVMALAEALASGPSGAYAGAKRLMNASVDVDRLEAHLRNELDALCSAADGPDVAEGVTAFFEKRPAHFTGI